MSKETLNLSKEFNIIQIPENSKIPKIKWEIYQEKRYDKSFPNNDGNYAIICGKTSHNLLVFDLDLKDKKDFGKIFRKFKEAFSEIANTKIVSTPHGFHFYYFMKGFQVDRKPNKNAGYNDKLKFVGSLKTKYKDSLKGFDILGNNGYVITWNSKVDGLEYKEFIAKEIKYITKSEYEQIRDFFLLKKQKRMRKPFYDILNGKLEIEEQASKTGKEEFLYWKFLYREAYNDLGLKPEELFKGLEKNQPNFDLEKTRTQLEHHPYTKNPLTNESMEELFPTYYTEKSIAKEKEKEKPKETIEDLKKRDSKETKKYIYQYHNLQIKKKTDILDTFLSFKIAGEERNRLLLFFLMLSNYRKKSRTLIILRGGSSGGKNHLIKNVLKLFPERVYMKYSSSTARVFNYENLEGKIMLYLREMRPNEESEEVFKSIYDGDRTHKEVVRRDGQNVVLDHMLSSLGIITTLSFENIQIDLINRAWVLTIDMTYTQTKKIIKFDQKRRKDVIERNRKKKKIKQYRKIISESHKYLDWDFEVDICFIEELENLFPKKPKLNVRRDINKLYNVIDIITIYNQKRRRMIEFDGKKYLFAEFEDLQTALDITKELYVNLILHIDDVKKDILKAFDPKKEEKGKKTKKETQQTLDVAKELTGKERIIFTITKMHDNLKQTYGHNRKTTERKMFSLAEEGYLDKIKEKNMWKFWKLKDMDILGELNLTQLKEKIETLVEQRILFYSNIEERLLKEENGKLDFTELFEKEENEI